MTTRPPALPWWRHLEEMRLHNGWSRTQLAVKAGVARSTIDNWKTSRRPPLNTTIDEVAQRLDIDKEQAFRLAGILPEGGPIASEDPKASKLLSDEAGDWLRVERERRGLSVREFAAALSVAAEVVDDWEAGESAVTDECADQIAELFGMDIIEVRRNLGLWVPPDEARTSEEWMVETDAALDELEAAVELIKHDPEKRRRVADMIRAAFGDAPPPPPNRPDGERQRDAG